MTMTDPREPLFLAAAQRSMDDPEGPRCPVCGAECERLYRRRSGEIVGCEACVEDLDAWDVYETDDDWCDDWYDDR